MNFVAKHIHEFTGESPLEMLNSEIRHNAALVYIRDRVLPDFLNVIYANDELINITAFVETFKNKELDIFFYNGHNDDAGYVSREVSDLIESAVPICEHIWFLADETIDFLSHMIWNDSEVERATVREILEIYIKLHLLPAGHA